jgi:ankyrin repeat protein
MNKSSIIFTLSVFFYSLFAVEASATEAKLISAAKTGNIKSMQALIDQGFSRETSDTSGKSLLLLAAANGKYAAAEFLINEGSDVKTSDLKGNTLLHLLAVSSKKEAVALMERALNRGADINALNFNSPGQTPAEIAVSKGNIPALELLMSRGVRHNYYFGNRPMIIYAYETGQINAMKFIADKGADIDSENQAKETLLHIAVMKNDMATVKYLTEKKASLERKGPQGRTALFMAAEKGYWKIAEFLIQSGAGADTSDHSGKNIMHILASGKNNGNNITAFSAYGININKADSSGLTPLMTAVKNKRWENVTSLADAGADTGFTDNSGKTLLIMAIEIQNAPLASYLIGKGADLKKRDTSGKTALHRAASLKGKPWDSIIALIIQKGGDVNGADNTGGSPAGAAIDSGNFEGFKVLLDNGLNINLKEKNTDPLVLYAYKKNSKAAFTELIKRGADISLKDGEGNSILHLAAEKDDRAFFTSLMQMNPDRDLNIKNSAGKTPLFISVEKGKLQFSKMLLDRKESINLQARDNQGMTLLHYLASAKVGITLLSTLEVSPQQVTESDAAGRTPLALAVYAGLSENAAFFISKGADLNIKDQSGMTPLIIAVTKSDLKTTSLLLNGGASVNVKNSDGKSLLLISYENNRTDIFDILLGAGASPSEKLGNGNTLLHMSALGNKLSFIGSLVKNRADLNLLNAEGKTALMLASEKGYNNSVKALIAGGADVKLKDKAGESALFKSIKASGEGGYWCADLLIKGGAEINDRTASGTPLLHEAASLEKFSIVNLFLKNGGDPNIFNQRNETLIMILSRTQYSGVKDKAKSVQAAKLIIDLTSKGSNPDMPDKYGRTPLDIACRTKNTIIVEALIKGSANINGTDNSGNTALKKTVMDYTGDYKVSEKEKKSTTELLDLLIKNGADINSKDKFGRTALSHILKEANQRNYQKVADIIPILLARGAAADIKDNEGKTASDYAAERGNNDIRELVR